MSAAERVDSDFALVQDADLQVLCECWTRTRHLINGARTEEAYESTTTELLNRSTTISIQARY